MENPIQALELYADGSTKLLIRNQAGRGHRWREEPTCDLESACQRFLTLAPGYVPRAVGCRNKMVGTFALCWSIVAVVSFVVATVADLREWPGGIFWECLLVSFVAMLLAVGAKLVQERLI